MVLPGFELERAKCFRDVRVFISVDLPTFGRPTIPTESIVKLV